MTSNSNSKTATATTTRTRTTTTHTHHVGAGPADERTVLGLEDGVRHRLDGQHAGVVRGVLERRFPRANVGAEGVDDRTRRNLEKK